MRNGHAPLLYVLDTSIFFTGNEAKKTNLFTCFRKIIKSMTDLRGCNQNIVHNYNFVSRLEITVPTLFLFNSSLFFSHMKDDYSIYYFDKR